MSPIKDEELFRMLVENQRDLVAWADPSGKLLYVNPAYCRMVGKRAEELIGTSFAPLVHPEDRAKLEAATQSLFAPPYQCVYESRVKTEDGWRWLSWTVQAVLEGSGQEVASLIGTGRDISARKQAEQSLRESEEKFRSMAEHTGDLIALTDQEGVITYASPAARDLFRMEPREMCGTHFAEFIDESMRARGLEEFQKGQEQGLPTRGLELRIRRRDGSTFFAEISGSRIDLAESPGSLVVIRDISERKQAELALRESQQRNQAMLDANPDILFVFDPQGRVIDVQVNRVEDLYVPPDLFLGHKIEDHLPQEVCRLTYRKMAEARERGEQVQYTYSLDMKDQRHEYECRLVPLEDGSFLAVVRDVTEQKKVQEALAISQEQLRLFVDANTDLMFLKDREMRYRMVNQANAVFFNLEASEIIGKSDLDLMPREAALHCQESDRLAMDTKKAVTTYETVEDLVYEVHKLPVIVAGEAAGVAGIIRDITARRKAEEELQRSERKFRAAFLTSPDSITIKRLRDHRYLEVNNGFLDILGYEREEVLGKTSEELNIWSKSDQFSRFLDLLREKGSVENMEVILRCKNGDTRIGLMSARVVDLYGESSILSITRDITQHRQAEEEKARLEEQLQQVRKMESIGRLAGGVTHDFNNMLGVILGHTEMAMEQLDSRHPLQADLAEIRKAAERSADLTRQLLAFARKQTIAPRVLDPGETIAGMIKMLKRLIGEQIQLIWKPEAGLWPVRVDPSQIDQILANLCVNARDAISGVGTVVIEARNCHLDEAFRRDTPGARSGDFIRLSVSDTGCGMDQETVSRLFEPFFTTKELGKGTGLGLATVYGAVRQNDGFIDVVSETGRGTTITIYLPRFTGKVGKETMGEEKAQAGGRGTVLLVEDEPSILNMISIMLERNGYQVIRAGTPGEAMELARGFQGNIDMLMTDVIMPEMNGRDLAKNLLPLYPGLRRLFMSGYTSDVIDHHGVLEDGVHFIAKPFTMKELMVKVAGLLEGRP